MAVDDAGKLKKVQKRAITNLTAVKKITWVFLYSFQDSKSI